MSDNKNIDVEEYIRNIIRDERKPNMVPIETASRSRSIKQPMHGYDVAKEIGYVLGGANIGAGE